MEKFCVFCGEAPQNKNNEHVIPQWLIELTGDPKRTAAFGTDFEKKPYATRQFSFDSLVFPACSECNERFSSLEDAARPIILALLSSQAVSAKDFIVLLDWLDKVRVGLWLGYFYLDKNPLGINPSFHIESRIGRLDRMVAIIRVEEPSIGLSFSGPESKFYQLSPTCLGLRINGLWLINASGISLCSQRLGFPFAQPIRIREDHKLEVSLKFGSGRTRYPVERSALLPNTVSMYQPVFRSFLESDNGKEYLANTWVLANTAESNKGYGKLFVQRRRTVRLYPEGNSSDWIPSKSWKTWEVVNRVPEYIYGRLWRDFESAIAISSLEDDRKHMRRQAGMIKMMDRAMLLKVRESSARIRARTSSFRPGE